VPGAGRARVNRTSAAACVERKESPREEPAHLLWLASSVQGPEGRRNLRRGARAETKPSTRERSDGKTSRPDSETNDGAEDSGEPGLPDTSRSHFQNPPRKWWALMIISEQDRKLTRECRIRGNAGPVSRRV
jgi:BRCT domain type II-containing protein